ncbi:hypothetical protein ACFL2V_21420 [Pseudomonadota bacterium]
MCLSSAEARIRRNGGPVVHVSPNLVPLGHALMMAGFLYAPVLYAEIITQSQEHPSLSRLELYASSSMMPPEIRSIIWAMSSESFSADSVGV